MPNLDYEESLTGLVMGIDEAGRGPLAGPVCAAAVYLPIDIAKKHFAGNWQKVNDSKKLSETARNELAHIITTTEGCLWSVATASPREIDRLNILKATHLAMKRAAISLSEQYAQINSKEESFSILVDGLAVPSLPFPSKNLVKGDSKSLLIAAASILAKTTRDNYCLEMEAKYPGYGFAKHKGYPTKEHLEALRRLGPCEEHRYSFSPVSDQLLFNF